MSDYQRIEEIYSKAVLIVDLDERRKFVEEASAGDGELFNTVWPLCLAERHIREEDEDQLRYGQRVGNYKIIRQIGRGVLASVYLAAHRIIGNNAAIKVFKKAAISVEGEHVWRRDSDILSLLRHDSIARFYDAGFTRGKVPYVIMEYVDGVHIDKYCDDEKLSVRERLKLFRELCRVIQYIHDNKVIHLDLKPTNILVATFPDRRIKLIDFSASKLLQIQGANQNLMASQFSIAFSANYASPEQINEKRELIGPTSDVYSLGALLYEMMTGCPPLDFESMSLREIQRKINDEYPVPPSKRVLGLHVSADEDEGEKSRKKYDLGGICKNRGFQPKQLTKALSGDIDAIIMKCLEKERGKRYQSMTALDSDIESFLSGRPVKARGGYWYKFKKIVARLLGATPGMFGWEKWRLPIIRTASMVVLLIATGLVWYAARPKIKMLPWRDDSNTTPVAFYPDEGGINKALKVHEHRVQTLGDSTFIDLVKINGAAFRMGALENTSSDDLKDLLPNEVPQRYITIQTFYLGKTEVNQAQWLTVAMMPQVKEYLPPDPSDIKGGSLPVTNITFTQAVEFCERLSRRTGLKYRLPTEAEWEYACRAGTQTLYGFGNVLPKDVANYEFKSNAPLAGEEIGVANLYGLFNMNGNVWEWVQDRWHPNYDQGPPPDGKAWETITNYVADGAQLSNEYRRVVRGGTYARELKWCRCSARTDSRETDAAKNKVLGFRVALSAN